MRLTITHYEHQTLHLSEITCVPASWGAVV